MTTEKDVGRYYIDKETGILYMLTFYCEQPTVMFSPVRDFNILSIHCADGAPLMKSLVKLVPEESGTKP